MTDRITLTFPDFLKRVHADDVATGKAGFHKEGVCEICDAAREEMGKCLTERRSLSPWP